MQYCNDGTMRGCVPTTQGRDHKSNRFYERIPQIQFSLWRQSLLWNTCPLSCRIDTKDMVGISRNLHMVIFVLHCFTCFVCIIVQVSLTHFIWSLATCSMTFTEARLDSNAKHSHKNRATKNSSSHLKATPIATQVGSKKGRTP